MNVEEFNRLPSGRVLIRYGKKKFRVVKPITVNRCYTCGTKITGKAGRWERGGGHFLRTLCPLDSILELNKWDKDDNQKKM